MADGRAPGALRRRWTNRKNVADPHWSISLHGLPTPPIELVRYGLEQFINDAFELAECGGQRVERKPSQPERGSIGRVGRRDPATSNAVEADIVPELAAHQPERARLDRHRLVSRKPTIVSAIEPHKVR